MEEAETLQDDWAADPGEEGSLSESDWFKAQMFDYDVKYINCEENFINNSIILCIIVAISIALGIVAYIFKPPEGLLPLAVLVGFILIYYYFEVIARVITARSGMRKVRKVQKLLRHEMSRE